MNLKDSHLQVRTVYLFNRIDPMLTQVDLSKVLSWKTLSNRICTKNKQGSALIKTLIIRYDIMMLVYYYRSP